MLLSLGAITKSFASTPGASTVPFTHVCPGVLIGFARCPASRVDAGPGGGSPSGYNPADLLSAYKLPSSSTVGSGQTVAIVDAYDDPTAESDLAVYRSQYGLSACTTANGCFRKVNQTGGTKYPRTNGGLAEANSLHLDMVSAGVPQRQIPAPRGAQPAV